MKPKSGAFGAIFAIAMASYLSAANADDPPDRLAMTGDDPVLSMIAAQTDVMQAMSQKLSRIEVIVQDTNERTATRADVADILAKLEAMRLNVGTVTHPPVTSVPPVNAILPTVATGTVGFPIANYGERIIAIDGVAVNQTTVDPCGAAGRSIFATRAVPAASEQPLPD